MCQRHGGIVKPVEKSNEYLAVNLTREGRRKQVSVHRIVLEAFVGPCPDGMEACHNNGNRQDNSLANLRWDTRKRNHADKIPHGTWQGGERNPIAKLTAEAVLEIRASKLSLSELAAKFGVSKGCVSKAKYGGTWKHLTKEAP